ncbi:TPA: hypothetical protein ACXYOX_004220 [Escherichia coli]
MTIKRLFTAGALALALSGCGHYVAPETTQAVNKLKTITSDAELCRKWGYITGPARQMGNISTMQKDDFDLYYAQDRYIRDRIKASVAAGTFSLKPAQCLAEKNAGLEQYQADDYARKHPKKTEWQKVLEQ